MRWRCASAANSFSAPGHISPAEPIGATPIGRVVAPSEHLDVGRRLALDAVVRQQLDPLERVGVAIDAVFLVGAAVDEIEAEARHPPAGAPAQVVDGRIALPQPRPAGVLDRLGRPSIDHFSPEANVTAVTTLFYFRDPGLTSPLAGAA